MTAPRDAEEIAPQLNRLHAFRHFAEFEGRTQSQAHIKPLHAYVTCRLVLQGGFHPSELTPRPPLRVEAARRRHRLVYDPEEATVSEATLLGGLKTKDVDIVAVKEGIGPVLAVSCKGMTGAVRNLTNRLEETIGECTNIHIAYPTLVFGYLFLLRANREGAQVARTDAVLDRDGRPVEGIRRFHQALSAMTGRVGLRNDASRYEAIAMSLVEVSPDRVGELTPDFPSAESPIRFDQFFETMYRRYDERYVVSAPTLAKRTRRLEWAADSPAFWALPFRDLDYDLRIRA